MKQTDCSLAEVTADQALVLAEQLSKIDPWLRLGFTSDDFLQLIANTGKSESEGYAIINDGDLAGLLIIRRNWLFGDYLRILAVLPQAQRGGVGRKAINLLAERCQQTGAKNLWACVSAFNTGALTFYDEQGFERIGTLRDLVTAGEDEIFIRLRL